MDINNRHFFCSWSGGKDSCLSLYYALQRGGMPKRLLTIIENKERSRSHGLSLELLHKQAELIGIPLTAYMATWDEYEQVFIDALKELHAEGIEWGVYGDIDLDEHREWVEKVSGKANMLVYHPLWQKSRRDVVEEFMNAGFKAMIVVVNEKLCDKSFLGRMLDHDLIRDLEQAGVDAAGENGEFHTVVTGGPIFAHDLEYTLEKQKYDNGYWFQPISLK